ncbi:Extracellular serine-rich protein [Colletotrichum tanaceti]|uniref:Extracellular serine-rich protein n=1 Tax=Colletotrichum tanaceti TaxID=1306861 RepID=A0A4U6WY61_9PEZI|nr:Extracellular serine-rich protein [Colletotrichum tanaceti]
MQAEGVTLNIAGSSSPILQRGSFFQVVRLFISPNIVYYGRFPHPAKGYPRTEPTATKPPKMKFGTLAFYLSAMVGGSIAATINERQAPPGAPPAGPPPPGSKLITVLVGSPTREKSLLFYPEVVKANPGDVIQFQFWPMNHTVTQAAGTQSPCQPLQDQKPNAVHSGFIPGVTDGSPVGTFDVQVENTDPMYMYCAQGVHCQAGMVLIVNPKADADVQAYKQAAGQSQMNVPAKNVAGGVAGRIPANLALPPVV